MQRLSNLPKELSRDAGLPTVDLVVERLALTAGIEGAILKKLHLALSTDKVEETMKDYSIRLGMQPCSFIQNEYALWRTETLNVSIRRDPACTGGVLRHLGWEDPSAAQFTKETDVNGIVWERFTAQQQADEINELWPDANYQPGLSSGD